MLSYLRNFFKTKAEQDHHLTSFFKKIKVQPNDISLYVQALTHGSYVNESKLKNERLEFIGDAVLGAIVSEWLYQKYPGKSEGSMSKLRSRLVSRSNLNELGAKLGIHEFLLHKINESDFTDTNNYIGNAFEALVGAIYFDKGYAFTHEYIFNTILGDFVDVDKIEKTIKDYKSLVIIWTQKEKKDYVFETRKQGDERKAIFHSKFILAGELFAEGVGKNKKGAEQNAAKIALSKIEEK